MACMIKLPVVLGFDHFQVIGEMTVDADKLPAHSEYCFSLGFKVKKMKNVEGALVVEEAEPVTVSLVHDDQYFMYLGERRGH